jgi:hypothetical protein
MLKHSFGVIGVLILAGSAGAQTVWTGPEITFTKPNGANWKLPENQDRITDNVWITRKDAAGIYNIAVEPGFGGGSPADTEWASGSAADYEDLVFQTWINWVTNCPPCSVNVDAVVHLISEDIYIDIRFTSWSCCGAGGFSYVRSTPGGCLTVTAESIVCHADGSTFTYTVQGTDQCTGGSSSYVFTASGGAPGQEMCFTALVSGDGGLCCTTQMCIIVPDCAELITPGDVNQDNVVGISDVMALLAEWGPCSDCSSCNADFDGDCDVGIGDLLVVLANWN